MKKVNGFIYLLLCCIFLQNNSACIDIVKKSLDSQNSVSFVKKKSEDSKAEEDSEEKENESKEKEGNEENKEKEKESKNIKYLNSFVCTSSVIRLPGLYSSKDAKIFIQYFEIETPPPQTILFS